MECTEDNNGVCKVKFIKWQWRRRVEKEMHQVKAAHKVAEEVRAVEEVCCKEAEEVAKK